MMRRWCWRGIRIISRGRKKEKDLTQRAQRSEHRVLREEKEKPHAQKRPFEEPQSKRVPRRANREIGGPGRRTHPSHRALRVGHPRKKIREGTPKKKEGFNGWCFGLCRMRL